MPSLIARPLVASLRNEVVCQEDDIRTYVPDPPDGLLGFDESVRLALTRVKDADVATRWSDAYMPGAPSDPMPTDPDWAGGSLFTDDRSAVVAASPEAVWDVVESIGGDNGWYSLPWAWEVRGAFDRLIGGPGLRRGRRDPQELLVGEACDFWRVEEVVPGSLLRLRAEMKVPGPGVAGVPRRTRARWGHDTAPARHVLPARTGRPGVLVLGAALPRRRVPHDGHPDQRRGGRA